MTVLHSSAAATATDPRQALAALADVVGSQAGELAAGQFENLRGAEAGNEQPELPRGRRRRIGTTGANVGARTDTSFDQSLVLQIQQSASNRRPRDAEDLHQLWFARQASACAVTPGGDVGAQLAGNFAMLWVLGHA